MRIALPVSTWARGFGLALTLVAGGIASGQGIIYANPPQSTYYSAFYPGTLDIPIDINGDETTDFILRSNDSGSTVNNTCLIAQGGNAIVSMNSYAANMSSGDTVGASLNPSYQWSAGKTPISAVAMLLYPQPVEQGNFVGQSSGYIGFDVVSGGKNYYGWMLVSSGVGNDAAIYGEVVSWGYSSSPNASIAVGAVPEPSTYALLLMGGIALGFYKYRKPPAGTICEKNE